MNSCYASIECSLNPDLKGKAVAVGGSVENRHGIILAKTPEAKKYGVTTGEAIWQAKRKCPDLIVVEPHFDIYAKYSRLAKEIYRRYTDRIEPMGLDEAWCDITGSILAFGSVQNITDEIRRAFREELGITVSIGVSYNKIFAKLGSVRCALRYTTAGPMATPGNTGKPIPFFIGSSLLRQFDDHVGIGNILAHMGVEGAVSVSVADHHGSDDGQTGGLDGLQVGLDQQLALFDLVAVLDVHGEGLALQADSLQAHVDQDFRTAIGHQAHRVAGGKHHVHRGVTGRIDLALSRINGNAIAQHTFGEGGVGHFTNRHGLAGHGRAEFIHVLTEQLFQNTHI